MGGEKKVLCEVIGPDLPRRNGRGGGGGGVQWGLLEEKEDSQPGLEEPVVAVWDTRQSCSQGR